MAIAMSALALPLGAQGVSHDTSAVVTTSPIVARSAPDSLAVLSLARPPAWTYADTGVRANATKVAQRGFLERESSQSSAVMIVGGIAMFAGVIVSGKTGNILMVSGAVVGLVGLWRYAR
jgi:hypothetical protein